MAFMGAKRGVALSPIRPRVIKGAEKMGLPWDAYYVLTKAQANLPNSKVHPSSGAPNYNIRHDHLLDFTNVGTNTHAEIDTHVASAANPHTVTLQQAYAAGNAITVPRTDDWVITLAPGTGAGEIATDLTSLEFSIAQYANVDFDIVAAGASSFTLSSAGGEVFALRSGYAGMQTAGWIPLADDTYDLGGMGLPVVGDRRWKDLYLAGTIKGQSSPDITLELDAATGTIKSTGNMEPYSTDNTVDLGSTGNRFKDLYLAGNITDDTNTLTVANAKTAYDHSQDNTQAHSDYLLNNASDTTTGTITAAGIITTVDSGNVSVGMNLELARTSADPFLYTNVAGSGIKFRVGSTGVFQFLDSGNAEEFTIHSDGSIFAPNMSNLSPGDEVSWKPGLDGELVRTSSSIRFKKNVRDISDVAWIHELRPIIYDSKTDDNNNILGLIAEEVHEINPDVVSYDVEKITEDRIDDWGKPYKRVVGCNTTNIPGGVSYREINIAMLKEIQNLRKEVDALKVQVS